VAFTYRETTGAANDVEQEIIDSGGQALALQADSADPEALRAARLLAVNVRTIFVAIQAALPHFDAAGRIISIGSVLADRAPISGISVYAPTKAAIAGLTRNLARELGPRGITVNTIQRGPVATDMNPDSEDFADTVRSLTAVGHYGQPHDVADDVAFLARVEARFVTGTTWNVDGGYAL